MSTLAVTTIQAPGGTVPAETVRRGSAKSWVNFNGTGTVAIRDSFNVASITDGGAGVYGVNFSNAMPSANHGPIACCGDNAGNRLAAQVRLLLTTSYGVYSINHGNGVFSDAQYACGENLT